MTMKHTNAIAALAVMLAVCSCTKGGETTKSVAQTSSSTTSATSADSRPVPSADAPIAAVKSAVLNLATKTASALPINPHVKNRARAQIEVLGACLRLDQVKRAADLAEQIPGWQRGHAYALLARHFASKKDGAAADPWIEKSKRFIAGLDLETTEEWQRDRIRATLAKAELALGRADDVAVTTASLTASEGVELASLSAERVARDRVSSQLPSIETAISTGDFDLSRQAIAMSTSLHDIAYDDVKLRGEIVALIRRAWAKLPVPLRIDALSELVENALTHGDSADALSFAEEAHGMIEGVRWTPEAEVAALAKAGALRVRSGDAEGGHAVLRAAINLYEARRDGIVDIYRCDALVALGRAHASIGEIDAARNYFARGAEESTVNPNSRPRAENLVNVMVAMLDERVDPDDTQLKRLERIIGGLGSPW